VIRPISGAPSPSPVPRKERASIVFVENGQLSVIGGAFVLVDAAGVLHLRDLWRESPDAGRF